MKEKLPAGKQFSFFNRRKKEIKNEICRFSKNRGQIEGRRNAGKLHRGA